MWLEGYRGALEGGAGGIVDVGSRERRGGEGRADVERAPER